MKKSEENFNLPARYKPIKHIGKNMHNKHRAWNIWNCYISTGPGAWKESSH